MLGQKSSHIGPWCAAAILTAACLMCVPRSLSASPPSGATGLNLPVLLSLYDRVRSLAWHLEDVVDSPGAASSASGSDEAGPPLETLETIVIDPGHGGRNSGAIGIAEVQEKYLTLELALALRRELQTRYPELRVVLTRYWDTTLDLSSRTHLANRVDADLFVSLHYNAAVHQRAVGFETYYLATRQAIPGATQKPGQPIASAAPTVTGVDPEEKLGPSGVQGDELAVLRRDLVRARQHRFSGLLAGLVQRHLVEAVDSADRGVKQANFGVLRGALMPAIVVESGFLTHPEEGKQVLEDRHRRHLVQALTQAIEAYDQKRASIPE
jgi:N-acetylmuramoyl-L-alanine amidase